jgi:hypothetical protein
MVATRKYKEIYNMQASRRKATWFNMKKPVVNNYALGILVLRSQHLLKVLASIASRSLTVTDPQPNKIHFDKPTKPTKPRVSTNHVRVHAAEVVHVTMSRDYPQIVEYSLYRRALLHTSKVCARKSLQDCSMVSSRLQHTH